MDSQFTLTLRSPKKAFTSPYTKFILLNTLGENCILQNIHFEFKDLWGGLYKSLPFIILNTLGGIVFYKMCVCVWGGGVGGRWQQHSL